MKHRFGDQYARLEAIRAYIQMAGSILAEFRESEKLAHETNVNPDHVDELMGDLKLANDECQDLIDSVAADAAIEGAEKDTLLPPPPNPFDLEEIDPPFEDLRS